MLIDSHCHLDQFPNPQAVVAEAIAAGITTIVSVSEDLPSMQKVIALKKQFPETIMAGLAIHPARLDSLTDSEIDQALLFVEQYLDFIDVIGESGLDYKYATTEASKARQKSVLHRHFNLASKGKIPVNLHSRRAQRQVMEEAIACKQQQGINVQLHWFTASRKLARICNREKIYISVGPSILTQPDVEKVVKEIDLELILLESDGPVRFSGVPATPAQVAQVAHKVAASKQIASTEFIKQAARNFAAFLGTSP